MAAAPSPCKPGGVGSNSGEDMTSSSDEPQIVVGNLSK